MKLTDDILRDQMLLPHAWENDERLVVLARDMDPMSPRRGQLLYAGTRETFDAIDPLRSNVALNIVDQTIRIDGRFVANRPAEHTFERGDLIGWYVDDIPPSFSQGFNVGHLPALRAATDFEQAWADFMGIERGDGTDHDPAQHPVRIDSPAPTTDTLVLGAEESVRVARSAALISIGRETIAALKQIDADSTFIDMIRGQFALQIGTLELQ